MPATPPPPGAAATPPRVSILIAVFNKLHFTRQCLDRLERYATPEVPFEVIVVDNASSDGTQAFFEEGGGGPTVRYVRNDRNEGFARANNQAARLAVGEYLLLLNNDTLVRPGWLEAMLEVIRKDPRVGIVGIKQLFPYSKSVHHTGIMITPDLRPVHLYPYEDGDAPHVNKQREYQAVNGACLLIPRALYFECGQLDEGYLNGYEDVDLCLTARERGYKVVCCTTGSIYHYGQISETRTADDSDNARRFATKWAAKIKPDEARFALEDRRHAGAPSVRRGPTVLPRDAVYFADDLSRPSALSWLTAEIIRSARDLGAPVFVRQMPQWADGLPRDTRAALDACAIEGQPVGGSQIKWSHYWAHHMAVELRGLANLELFVINYGFAAPGTEPWDRWMQSLRQSRHWMLPISQFCLDVLAQLGLPGERCRLVHPGFSRELVGATRRRTEGGPFRLLSITNSHDPERYGTDLLLDAYWEAFGKDDDVVLVLKDYGVGSDAGPLERRLRDGRGRAPVEYRREFTSKQKLMDLYLGADGFVSAHRSEGYGMKLLDALAAGLPTVTSRYGGPADFCDASNTLVVDHRLVPVGDCYDTRALPITNAPTWSEPVHDSLVAQLRRLVADRAAAEALGAHARETVQRRFTWEAAARQLLSAAEAAIAAAPAPVSRATGQSTEPAERSPYWLGRRVSVLIPTFNRRAKLEQCLAALARQSILPSEYEVVVVDDGSTDGTFEWLSAQQYAFPLIVRRQENAGPGTARNLAATLATGEILLLIGDDIIPHDRLLEEHLHGHVQHRAPGDAVLGYIDWPPGWSPNALMQYVCGPSSLQFAYDFIPALERLDFRFFYTSNISLKRQFFLDALDQGVGFDRDFRYAAFEDSELAYRLEPLGLAIHYRADAVAYHDHWMDVEDFCRRERNVGRSAVIFFRKHPGADHILEVEWIERLLPAARKLVEDPALFARAVELDRASDELIERLYRALEHSTDFARLLADEPTAPGTGAENASGLRQASETLLASILGAARARGKADEWFAGVADPRLAEAAACLAGLSRKLQALSASREELQRLRQTVHWLDTDVVRSLRDRVRSLEQGLGLSVRTPLSRRVRTWLGRNARTADVVVRDIVGRHPSLMKAYMSGRNRVRDMVRKTPR